MSGVWWWLRGAGGERGSSESVSSVGSACTAASFAFVPSRWPPAPPAARHAGRRPAPRQPLHVKYGLPQDAAATLPVRRPPPALARRANSECGPRRAPHVPGKRRAPPPPTLTPRRRATKRPAPRPPAFRRYTAPPDLMDVPPADLPPAAAKGAASDRDLKLRPERGFLRQIFDNRWRNSSAEHAPSRILPSISELDREATRILETVRTRGVTSDSNDVYAARGRDCKDSWICTRCLRKYGATTPICVYCLPNSKQPCGSGLTEMNSRNLENATQTTLTNIDSSSRIEIAEKERLKEMLKEIKDSLPKRPKHNKEVFPGEDKKQRYQDPKPPTAQTSTTTLETPTLPMGYSAIKDDKSMKEPSKTCTSYQTSTEFSQKELLNPNNGPSAEGEAMLMTHQIIIMDPQARRETDIKAVSSAKSKETDVSSEKRLEKPEARLIPKQTTSSQTNTENETKSQPLRISSLLNPVYIPRSTNRALPKTDTTASKTVSTVATGDLTKPSSQCSTPLKIAVLSSGLCLDTVSKNKNTVTAQAHTENLNKVANAPNSALAKKYLETKVSSSNSKNIFMEGDQKPNDFNVQLLSQHSRKRELINQLEKSIAKGDEHAAADAATKLAQLRLSCSVLSFTSQIMTEASTSKAGGLDAKNKKEADILKEPKTTEKQKIPNNSFSSPLSKNSTAAKNANKNVVLPKIFEDKVNTERWNKTAVETKKVSLGVAFPGPSTSRGPASKVDDRVTTIQVWVEDKDETRGPIRLSISRSGTLRELKQRAEALLGLSTGLQRWIVGKSLCNDDSTALVSLAGPQLAVPFYLCLVEKETKKLDVTPESTAKPSVVYSELIALEERALIPNTEPFECSVCLEQCGTGEGVVLRECVHSFCRACLSEAADFCQEGALGCPALGCTSFVQEREVRALLPAPRYERWLARGLARAEGAQRSAFHCRTPDCAGWALCDPGVTTFPCPVCKRDNCVSCQAIHSAETCSQYRHRLESAHEEARGGGALDDGTQALLTNMIAKGEALACPECGTVITKKWGCDWVKCAACKTEICWVTRGRRWGPAGRGDTSAGCRCGVDGQRCHPTCGYCH